MPKSFASLVGLHLEKVCELFERVLEHSASIFQLDLWPTQNCLLTSAVLDTLSPIPPAWTKCFLLFEQNP